MQVHFELISMQSDEQKRPDNKKRTLGVGELELPRKLFHSSIGEYKVARAVAN